MPLQIPPGHINVLAISEALVDFISLEERPTGCVTPTPSAGF